jgi:bacterial/archaeal transporter family protein
MHYLVYVLGAMIAWGFWGFLPRLAVSRLDPSSAQVFTWIGTSMGALPLALIYRERVFNTDNLAAPLFLGLVCAVGAGVCGFFGGLMYNRAFASCGDNTPAVIGISALYPVVSILLAVVFLKQRVNFGQFAGIALCVVGAVLLAYFSRSDAKKSEPAPVVEAAETAASK